MRRLNEDALIKHMKDPKFTRSDDGECANNSWDPCPYFNKINACCVLFGVALYTDDRSTVENNNYRRCHQCEEAFGAIQ